MSVELWDSWNAGGGPKYPHNKIIQYCFRHYQSEERKGKKALDVGCGSGVNSIFLAAEGFDVTGLDISEVGLNNTRVKFAENRIAIKAVKSSLDCLPFKDDSFDLIISVGAFECVAFDCAARSVQEAKRVLKNNGRGIYIFAGEGDFRLVGENKYQLHGYTYDEVKQIFSAGFLNLAIDQYITTYDNGKRAQRDWLITLQK